MNVSKEFNAATEDAEEVGENARVCWRLGNTISLHSFNFDHILTELSVKLKPQGSDTLSSQCFLQCVT